MRNLTKPELHTFTSGYLLIGQQTPVPPKPPMPKPIAPMLPSEYNGSTKPPAPQQVRPAIAPMLPNFNN